MPTKVNVKINTVQHTTFVSNAGNTLNYVEATGFNATDNKGFKKRCFATKKDGTATKNAETLDALNQDDWAEFTLDDTSYQNIQTVRKIQEPAGMSIPSQKPTHTAGKGGARTYKADPKKTQSIARSVALKAAVEYGIGRGLKKGDDNVASILDVARRFEEYLNPTDIPEVDGEVREPLKNGGSITNPTPNPTPAPVEDDDIPF